jgi:hypothetical protein
MRRYFYSDPLAAVWMAKHFRMKLAAGGFCLMPESVDAFLQRLGSGVNGERYVDHPDSAPLLDPRPGDLVEDDIRSKVRVLTPAHFPYKAALHRIVQRNGRPFHWPEKVDA